MEPSFDLDINNYNVDDLIKFFKLEKNFSFTELIKKEEELAIEILSSKNPTYNPKYKFDIINFMKSAKEVLISIKNDIENIGKKDRPYNLNKGSDPNVGKILNPLSSHPALQKQIIAEDDINGYRYETTTAIYSFNTAARNDFFNTQSSECYFDLPIDWTNVIEISLASANIPNVMYAFNSDQGTNQIYISEDNTGLSGLVTIPQGNYVPFSLNGTAGSLPISQASFPDVLEKAINDTLGTGTRFKVTFNAPSYTMTITNTTNTFLINTVIKDPTFLCNQYSNKIYDSSNWNGVPNIPDISLPTYLQTLGYLMGYRAIFYKDSMSYTTESVFSSSYSDYIYFNLNDYTGSQLSSSTYGIAGPTIIGNNILGIIPINSGVFTTTFDNNSNFIYKKRQYFGPVNISRIAVKLLNETGNIVNLHSTEFSFTIQVKSIYNLRSKSVMNLRSTGSI